MNKKLRNLILSGVLSVSIVAPLSTISNAESYDKDSLENITNAIEIKTDNGELLDLGDVTVESKVVDVEIENSEVLIAEGLLSEDYKTEMIEDLNSSKNSRAQKEITVWFDYPVTITQNYTLTNPYENNIRIVSFSTKGTFVANSSKQLKSSISFFNRVNHNGYITSFGVATQGLYVNKGGTSKSSKTISGTKPGFTINSKTFYYNAKYVSYKTTESTQVGFGIGATVTYN